jgi:hypothetical protein
VVPPCSVSFFAQSSCRLRWYLRVWRMSVEWALEHCQGNHPHRFLLFFFVQLYACMLTARFPPITGLVHTEPTDRYPGRYCRWPRRPFANLGHWWWCVFRFVSSMDRWPFIGTETFFSAILALLRCCRGRPNYAGYPAPSMPPPGPDMRHQRLGSYEQPAASGPMGIGAG